MKVLLCTLGSRGDVQPFIALAKALQLAGHDPLLVAGSGLQPLADQYCINIASPTFDSAPPDSLKRKLHRVTLNNPQRKPSEASLVSLRKHISVKILDSVAQIAHKHADIIVYRCGFPWHHLAEWLSIPEIAVVPGVDLIPTRSFQCHTTPIQLPNILNLSSFKVSNWYEKHTFGMRYIDRWRTQSLGLPLRRSRHDLLPSNRGARPVPVLQPISRYLLPENISYPDWAQTTGFWSSPLPVNWKPERVLADFLDKGDSPILISLGRTSMTYPRHAVDMAINAARTVGRRAIVITGFTDIKNNNVTIKNNNVTDDEVLFLHEAPMTFLLPRVSAVVHHGGTGTTCAALVAGCPQVICPHAAYGRNKRHLEFNAQSMHRRGLTPTPQPASELRLDNLTTAIDQATTDTTIARNVRDISTKVDQEEGVNAAIKIVREFE